MINKTLVLCVSLLVYPLLSASSFASVEYNCLSCAFELRLGGSIVHFNSKIRIDGQSNDEAIGDSLDFEDDLNFSKEDDFFYASFNWRFFERHRLNLNYVEYKRSASVTSQKDIRLEGDLLVANASIFTKSRSRIKDIEYVYEFYQADSFSLGSSVGVYWSTRKIDFFATGEVESDGEDAATFQQNYRKSAKVDIPLPTIGIHLNYNINPRWLFKSSIRSLKVNINNQEGSFRNFNMELDYAFSKNILGGIAITSRSLKVVSNRDELTGQLNGSYSGLDLFIISRF